MLSFVTTPRTTSPFPGAKCDRAPAAGRRDGEPPGGGQRSRLAVTGITGAVGCSAARRSSPPTTSACRPSAAFTAREGTASSKWASRSAEPFPTGGTPDAVRPRPGSRPGGASPSSALAASPSSAPPEPREGALAPLASDAAAHDEPTRRSPGGSRQRCLGRLAQVPALRRRSYSMQAAGLNRGGLAPLAAGCACAGFVASPALMAPVWHRAQRAQASTAATVTPAAVAATGWTSFSVPATGGSLGGWPHRRAIRAGTFACRGVDHARSRSP